MEKELQGLKLVSNRIQKNNACRVQKKKKWKVAEFPSHELSAESHRKSLRCLAPIVCASQHECYQLKVFFFSKVATFGRAVFGEGRLSW